MISDCDKKHPLQRDGLSQKQRLLCALKPDYVRIDERELPQLLAFAKRYAQQLQYYDDKNNPAGDWQSFLEKDVTTVLADILSKNDQIERSAIEQIKAITTNATEINTPEMKSAIKLLFQIVATKAIQLDHWFRRSMEGLRLRTELERLISSTAAEMLRKGICWFKAGIRNGGYFEGVDALPFEEAEDKLVNLSQLGSHNFHPVWIPKSSGMTDLSWRAYFETLPQEDSVFASIAEAESQLFAFFSAFHDVQIQLCDKGTAFIAETLESWPNHEPHMGLFLAFLQLFQYAQNSLNKFTQRHLDYYLEDVLHLLKKPALADKVHIIFELAKHVDRTLVEKGTKLNAGKDSTGNDIVYTVNDDIVINKAQVAELKKVFIDVNDKDRIYAASVANSADGIGGEFTCEDKRWKPFGEPQKTGNGAAAISSIQPGEIGCAIASPLLFLEEGVRTITVTFHISNPLQISDLTLTQNDFVLSLTTEQGWFTVPKARVTVAPSPLQTNGGDSETIVSSPTVDSDTQEPIQFTLGLEQADPSICAYDPAVHGGSFETSVPMMKIALTNGIGSGYVYQSLRDFRLTKIDLSVTVVDAKNLIIQNDAGVLKTGKPFYPFTTVPKIGSKFYLGSREIFQKRLTDLKLSLIWGDVPANLATHYGNYGGTAPANSDFKATVDILQDSKWLSLKGNGNEINLFNSNDAQEENTIQFSNDELGTIQAGGMEDTVLPWSVESKRGFLRLTLTSPKNNAFGHGVYRDLYTKSLILFADSPTGKDSNGTAYKDLIPNAPYTPLINEISASYTARETVDPADQQALDIAGSTYYHLYPFGSKAQNSGTEQSLKLMPQFVTRQKNSEGELYIGLHGLKPAQSISLLFQLAEGSARPDLRVEPVYWSYLANNNWHPFDPAEVLKDTTNGLLNSGIVALAVPDTASKENTLLPAGLHWLRASVVGKPAALCDLISIQAQAVQASRLIASTNKNIQMQSLPAGRIKKMLTKSAAVKSVSQPFSTFGGESAEESGDFYIRSSERLRHKQRGVSISDYEKLVLQQFPAIYRAKCISHSMYSLSSSDTNSFYSEFAPGHIALIIIPHLQQNNAVNRLQPKVSLAQSEQIRSWLCNQISPFAAANMHVMNPYYEEIQVEFRVSFTTSDWGFYQKQLNTDIQNFLSPWAISEAADIVFRGRIHKSSILNFVEKLDYVDYVTDFKMHHTGGRQNFYNTNEATPTTECSILVSHQNHLINQMGENE